MLDEDAEFFRGFKQETLLEEYVSNMREEGTWGTQLEIVSLCQKYNVHCVIFRPDGLHYRIECNDSSPETRILMLSHHNDDHFNEVRFFESGRVLESFNEPELLLTELESSHTPKPVSKKESRAKRRQKNSSAPQLDIEQENDPLVSIQKLLEL